MEQIKVKAKKWGNSLGVLLPKQLVHKQAIKEGSEIVITVQTKKTMTVRDLMDFARKHPLPKSKKTTREIMDEIDKELWPEDE